MLFRDCVRDECDSITIIMCFALKLTCEELSWVPGFHNGSIQVSTWCMIGSTGGPLVGILEIPLLRS